MAFSRSTEEHLKFTVNNYVTVTVVSGDITQMQADAVVIGEDEHFTGIGAVAKAFAAVGGLDYAKAKYYMITTHVPSGPFRTFRMKPVYWCDAGSNFKYKRIYHAVLPKVHGFNVNDLWKTAIADLYKNVCGEADNRNRETSIVLPVLGSGGAGGDFNDTVCAALNGIRAFPSLHLKDVYLVEQNQEKAKKIVSVCQRWIEKQQKKYNNMSCRILSGGSASGSQAGATAMGYTPQHQTASSNLSGGLSGSGHDPDQSGSQGITTWSSSSSIVTRSRSRTHGGRSSTNNGDQPSTERPSSSSDFGTSSTVNTHSWRDPLRQATSRDNDVGKVNFHMENVAGASYGSSSTSSSHTPRHPLQQSKTFDENLGNSNNHMENVVQAVQERRRAGKERAGQGHSDVMAARWTEKSYGGHESQGLRSGHHGDDSEHQHSHRRRHRDRRHITAMEVDEDPGPTSGLTRNHSKPELQEKTELNPNPPKIVVMTISSGESSDDETSPHLGTERQTRTARRESGTPPHLSKTGSHQAASPRTEPSVTREGLPENNLLGKGRADQGAEQSPASGMTDGHGGRLQADLALVSLEEHRPRDEADASQQEAPNDPDHPQSSPGTDQHDSCLGRGQRKRLVQQPSTTDIVEEAQSEPPVPTNRGQRKSKACWDKGPEVPDSLQKERPPSKPGSDANDDADLHFRGQRKSKAQVPREGAAVSHQRSPSSPDPALDRDLPPDTSSSGRGTDNQDQPREKALDAQSSEEDEGAEPESRGRKRDKPGVSGMAAGSTGGNSDKTKSSDKATLLSIVGTMPRGRMNHFVNAGIHVPGFEGFGVIVVDYDIPDGIQKSEHPQPGSPYCGCAHRTFLPDNDEGRRVLGLLEEAFDRRLPFQVCEQPGGQALVEWADIPHKTCLRGPRERGYPDSEYLGTVRDILREKYGLE